MRIRLKQNNSEINIFCPSLDRAVELSEKLLPYSYSSEIWIQLAPETEKSPALQGNVKEDAEEITQSHSTPKEEPASSAPKKKPGRVPQDFDWDEYKRLRKEGKTMKEIAEHFFISEGTLFNRVKARREKEKAEGVKE